MEGMNFTLIQKLHEHGEFDIHIMVAIIVKDWWTLSLFSETYWFNALFLKQGKSTQLQ